MAPTKSDIVLDAQRKLSLRVRDEKKASKKAGKLAKEALAAKEREELALIESKELDERRKHIQIWMEKLAQIKTEEFECEEACSIPSRHYLMTHIIPTLTKSFIDVARTHPEDSMNFLADFLIQNNPPEIKREHDEHVDDLNEPEPKHLSRAGEHQCKAGFLNREQKEALAKLEYEELEERKKRIQGWMDNLAQVKKEEIEREEEALIPLRNYLMAQVVPTLTKALIDVTRNRPEDPIDYLATYLFQNNPGGINPSSQNIFE